MRVGINAAAGGSGGGSGSAGDSAAEADRTSDFAFDPLAATLSPADPAGRVDALVSVNVRADRPLSSSRLEMNGFAAAIMTFEGAGAAEPSRNVAISMVSSLPSSGAGPTYSTRTRASPLL